MHLSFRSRIAWVVPRTPAALPLETGRGGAEPLRLAAALTILAGFSVLTAMGWMALLVALSFGSHPEAPTIFDFDVFHLVGRLTVEGRLAEAYEWAKLKGLEAELGVSATGYLPFAYPPPFALLMAALSPLPIGASFAGSVLVGAALLGAALMRLAPGRFWTAAVALSPAVFANVMVGQNGMATAGLAGLAAALGLSGRGGPAGAVGGLLAACKPQTAVTLPLLFLLRRDWRALAISAVSAFALLALSVALLGPGIVPAFLGGLAETSRALAEGRFPLHRMVSVYACLRSLGAPAALAMPVHMAVAAAAVLAAATARRRGGSARAEAGLLLAATAFVSPYFYDYDTAVAGVGLALALPAGAPRRCALAFAAVAVAGGVGVFETLALEARLSLGAPLLLVAFGVALTPGPGRTHQRSIWLPISTARVGGRPK